jgi:Family of unknown function (DUF6314)
MQLLLDFWDRLHTISQLTFYARSAEATRWQGKGDGEVVVIKENPAILIFKERGTWQSEGGALMSFSNVFRWTLLERIISLEHLRQGPAYPVFLFNLAPSDNSLRSAQCHLCKEDTYSAQMHFANPGFYLHWHVLGPKKNEKIDYTYS